MQELIKYFEQKLNKPLSDFIKEDWHYVSCQQILSEDFIKRFHLKLDWYWISSKPTLSESFIKEFEHMVFWENISYCQVLSEDFIRKFKDKVYWNIISAKQTLSEPFIREFQDKIDIKHLSKHNRSSWLKYQVKDGLIAKEEYLKELCSN